MRAEIAEGCVSSSSSSLHSSLELSDTQSLCALGTSPPRNRCIFMYSSCSSIEIHLLYFYCLVQINCTQFSDRKWFSFGWAWNVRHWLTLPMIQGVTVQYCTSSRDTGIRLVANLGFLDVTALCPLSLLRFIACTVQIEFKWHEFVQRGHCTTTAGRDSRNTNHVSYIPNSVERVSD